jgi:hypothetical protein
MTRFVLCRDLFAVDDDFILVSHTVADLSNHTIDLNAAFLDPCFGFAP